MEIYAFTLQDSFCNIKKHWHFCVWVCICAWVILSKLQRASECFHLSKLEMHWSISNHALTPCTWGRNQREDSIFPPYPKLKRLSWYVKFDKKDVSCWKCGSRGKKQQEFSKRWKVTWLFFYLCWIGRRKIDSRTKSYR